MVAMFMSAVEATIVSTAMPSIVSELGGFSLYSWVFSSYLLMQVATILIYGKTADLFGRKPVFVTGVIIFLIGSLLCGFASTMKQLIVYRFIQGIGAGAVMPIATTIVGDIYTKEERASIQGYLSSVWGISAIVGPVLGGILVKYVSWVYVFWMNLPLGLLAIAGVVFFLHEDVQRKKHVIDYKGSILLVLSISAFMLVLVEGGVHWAWNSWQILTLLAIFLIGFVLWVREEKRTPEPMMPFNIWRYRAITVSNTASFTTGMILMGVSTFLPAFVQGVLEQSPMVAGFTLTTMSIGWPIASTIAGKMVVNVGYRKLTVAGACAIIIGSIIFILMSPDKGPVWPALGSLLVGAGMGLTTTSFIVSVQSTVDWNVRGVATASNMFMRTLGSAVGAALLGGLLNGRLQSFIEEKGLQGEITIETFNLLLDEQQRASLIESMKILLQDGLSIALNFVYWGVVIIAILTLFLVFFMPETEEQMERS
ncbi:MDR family MFS transporter [Calidifontibacillus erzurumensis]|uniref:MFS transporter n=1 Tax=Calidifontibacillus erzurumensis TaxID=2741433 RepID=A0A8J8GED2_9BACI|nr:MDR family MFS transporter [Calidifontibacillus erzurumensis]NSL50705.1 MFS transporter [Calidifontibacillus erzurumensis]